MHETSSCNLLTWTCERPECINVYLPSTSHGSNCKNTVLHRGGPKGKSTSLCLTPDEIQYTQQQVEPSFLKACQGSFLQSRFLFNIDRMLLKTQLLILTNSFTAQNSKMLKKLWCVSFELPSLSVCQLRLQWTFTPSSDKVEYNRMWSMTQDKIHRSLLHTYYTILLDN